MFSSLKSFGIASNKQQLYSYKKRKKTMRNKVGK